MSVCSTVPTNTQRYLSHQAVRAFVHRRTSSCSLVINEVPLVKEVSGSYFLKFINTVLIRIEQMPILY